MIDVDLSAVGIAPKGRNLNLRELRAFIPFHELLLAFVLGIVTLLIGAWLRLPLVGPNLGSLLFTGMSPMAPTACVVGWAVIAYFLPDKRRLLLFALIFVAYMCILVFHFNIKLWMTAVNPRLWDGLYWQIDEAVRPMVDASFALHQFLKTIFGGFADRVYLFAFLAMFAASTIIHSFGPLILFRRLFFAAMLVHALGGLAYLIMPAIGPFIYEHGVNPVEAVHQVYMVGVHQNILDGGARWLEQQGGAHIFGGPAAMPSLHVASSAVFVIFAWRNKRWLCWFYIPLFAFIWMEAMATRWHYAIDLFVGFGLALLCVAISDWLLGKDDSPLAEAGTHPTE